MHRTRSAWDMAPVMRAGLPRMRSLAGCMGLLALLVSLPLQPRRFAALVPPHHSAVPFAALWPRCKCRFEVDFCASLNDSLSALGVKKPFAGGDITRIAADGSGNALRDLFVSDVLHKVYAKVGPTFRDAVCVWSTFGGLLHLHACVLSAFWLASVCWWWFRLSCLGLLPHVPCRRLTASLPLDSLQVIM